MATTLTVQQLQSIHDRYISSEGAVNLPEGIKRLIDVGATGKSGAGWQVNKVVDFVSALAGVCILLGNKEEAERVMRTGFGFINGTRMYAERFGEYRGCVCDVAQRVGDIANCLGLPNITEYVSWAVNCPDSPRGYLPEIHRREVTPEEVLKGAQSWAGDFLNEGKWSELR